VDEVSRAHSGPDLAPGAILEVLVRREVDFVLIGGLAANSYGSPFPTYDVDIVPRSDRANLDRLSVALHDLDARIRSEGIDGGIAFDHDGTSLAAVGVWNLITPFGMLDISFVPSGTRGYADLIQEAVPTPAFGVVVTIASLADIVRSKQAANRDKDRRVLPVLRELLDKRLDDN
jgi:hypothetical protein